MGSAPQSWCCSSPQVWLEESRFLLQPCVKLELGLPGIGYMADGAVFPVQRVKERLRSPACVPQAQILSLFSQICGKRVDRGRLAFTQGPKLCKEASMVVSILEGNLKEKKKKNTWLLRSQPLLLLASSWLHL